MRGWRFCRFRSEICDNCHEEHAYIYREFMTSPREAIYTGPLARYIDVNNSMIEWLRFCFRFCIYSDVSVNFPEVFYKYIKIVPERILYKPGLRRRVILKLSTGLGVTTESIGSRGLTYIVYVL